MTPAEAGRAMADAAPPLTEQQVDEAARMFVALRQRGALADTG